jgi:hypothetical protein
MPDESQLDPEELAYARAHADIDRSAGLAPGGLTGELLIRRRPLEILVPAMALMLAAIVAAMGQPLVGGAVAAATVAALALHGRRRAARLVIAPDGTMSIPRRLEPIDWAALTGVRYRVRHPFGASTEGARAAQESASITFTTHDGRRLRLARGALWRLHPRPEPLSWAALERAMLSQAKQRLSETLWLRQQGE